MDNTFSEAEFIDVTLTAVPVPPGTKSTRYRTNPEAYGPQPPESPPADHPPEQTPDTEAKE